MSDLSGLSLTEAADRLRGGAISAAELTRAYLDRIADLDGRLRSFITVTAERAEADARRADAALRGGRPLGPLHGVPLAVKDLLDTADVRTTANSRLQAEHVPRADATVVRRLSEAGAVLLGKLQMNEFAMGTTAEDDLRPPARNPWDLERTPGGSSSGSAVALAAGLCAGSFGSDTGGSIRAPASYCGVVGLKPTFGRVSRHGVAILSWSLDHIGPMARTVADVAALLQVTAGPDPLDPAALPVGVPDYRAALDGSARGVRIGIPASFLAGCADLDPEVRSAFDAAVEALRDLGATVRDVGLREIEHIDAVLNPILLGEAAAQHVERLRTRGREYGRGFRLRVLEGYFYTAVDYVQAQRGRQLLIGALDEVLEEVDVIATPTMHRTAPTAVEQTTGPRSPFTSMFNLTGLPAISVPCGFGRGGLPIGLQLAGRRFEEAGLLRVADAYERASTWRSRRPPLGASASA